MTYKFIEYNKDEGRFYLMKMGDTLLSKRIFVFGSDLDTGLVGIYRGSETIVASYRFDDLPKGKAIKADGYILFVGKNGRRMRFSSELLLIRKEYSSQLSKFEVNMKDYILMIRTHDPSIFLSQEIYKELKSLFREDWKLAMINIHNIDYSSQHIGLDTIVDNIKWL